MPAHVPPTLTTTPVDLSLRAAAVPDDPPLGEGIRRLYGSQEFSDCVLVIGARAFPIHQVMLASMSASFRQFLLWRQSDLAGDDPMHGTLVKVEAPALEGADAADQRLWLQVQGVAEEEAMLQMLEHVYLLGTGVPSWEYAPSTAEVNADVLRLATSFQLPYLQEYAARWLVHGLTTANVVERLVSCEEFGFVQLRSKIITQIIESPEGLTLVTRSPEIMRHPQILQELLLRMASRSGTPQPAQGEPAAPAPTASQPEVGAKGGRERLQEKMSEKGSNPSPVKRARKAAGGA